MFDSILAYISSNPFLRKLSDSYLGSTDLGEKLKKRVFEFEEDTTALIDFDEIIAYIKKLDKHKLHRKAVFALMELKLKFKSGLNYNEELAKRFQSLSVSNIDDVAKHARSKIARIAKANVQMEKRLAEISKILDLVDSKVKADEAREARIRRDKEFELMLGEVLRRVKDERFADAIELAKQMVIDFEENPKAAQAFRKVEIQHARYLKKNQTGNKEGRTSAFLQRMGVANPDFAFAQDLIEEHPFLLATKNFVLSKFNGISNTAQQFKEEQERRAVLGDIESMLVKSGGIAGASAKYSGALGKQFQAAKEGFIKDIGNFSLPGFNFMGKILSKDEFTGDAFGFYHNEKENKTIFYIGDATGHGIQASFTVAITSKLFYEVTQKTTRLDEIVMTINNELKSRIQGRYFLTAVFFEWDHQAKTLSYIGGWHDPMYVFRKRISKLEKVIPGGLAIGVRVVKNAESLKIKQMPMDEDDIVFLYTDGIIESRSIDNELFGLERLEKVFLHASIVNAKMKDMHEGILDEIEKFRSGRAFDDDVSLHVLKRSTQKDVLTNRHDLDEILKELNASAELTRGMRTKNRTKEQIAEEVRKKKYETDLKVRLVRLQQLYELREYSKLKSEVVTYYKDGFAHRKMKYYLQKVLEKEDSIIIAKQDEKLAAKFRTLEQMYKKWQYDIVIRDCIEVINKNGKI